MKSQNSETNCREPNMNSNDESLRLQITSLNSQHINPIKHTMAILKAALPYVDVHSMRSIEAMVKVTELLDTFNSQSFELSTLNLNEGKGDMEGMLNSIKAFCTDRERDLIDIILNLLMAKKFYTTYQAISAASNNKKSEGNPFASAFGFDENANMMDILSGMLTPEQKSTFETLNMVMSAMPNLTT